jgi:hypothetical protein
LNIGILIRHFRLAWRGRRIAGPAVIPNQLAHLSIGHPKGSLDNAAK